MTERIQKYQIIKFDSFDFLIILILKKDFYRQTDRPTNQQTFGPIEATCRRLKTPNVGNRKTRDFFSVKGMITYHDF